MSSNGNTWGRQRGRSAACNSLTEGEERRRARGDRGFHKGQREGERGMDGQEERWERRHEVCRELTKRGHCADMERSGTGRIKEASSPLTTHFAHLRGEEDSLM